MGAYIVYFMIGSVAAIPFLAFLLLRTRRDLNELRAELRVRGVIAPGGDEARAALAAPSDEARPLAPGADAGPVDRQTRAEARAIEGEASQTGRAP